MSMETFVACGNLGFLLSLIFIVSDLSELVKDWLTAKIERYRAETEAIKEKHKETK